MADRKLAFGSASQGITITLASLAQAAARQSTAIDNTSNLFLDAMVYLAIPILTGTPGSDKAIYIYAFGSEDGTNYDDNAGATDAAITLRVPSNLRFLDVILTPDSGALTYKKVIPSVARAFGGILPPKWGIVIKNMTNLAFNATEGNLIKEYRGIYETII
jgi:hypothetical protein